MFCSFTSHSYLVISLFVPVFTYARSCFLLGVCARPGKLINGKVVGSNYSHGAVIKFECNKAYELRGSTNLMCKGNVWEGQFPECEGKFMLNINNNDNINISIRVHFIIVTVKVTEIDIRANEKAVYSLTLTGTLLGSAGFLKKGRARNLTCCMLYLHLCSKFSFHYSLMQFEFMIVYSCPFRMCPGWCSVLGILEHETKRRQLLESFHHKDKCNTFRLRIGKR